MKILLSILFFFLPITTFAWTPETLPITVNDVTLTLESRGLVISFDGTFNNSISNLDWSNSYTIQTTDKVGIVYDYDYTTCTGSQITQLDLDYGTVNIAPQNDTSSGTDQLSERTFTGWTTIDGINATFNGNCTDTDMEIVIKEIQVNDVNILELPEETEEETEEETIIQTPQFTSDYRLASTSCTGTSTSSECFYFYDISTSTIPTTTFPASPQNWFYFTMFFYITVFASAYVTIRIL